MGNYALTDDRTLNMQASHCMERPGVGMNWSKQLPGICQILTIDQDLRPSADFGQTNLGWDPLIIGDVHHCLRISMRGQLLMTRGLLFKSKDHVIQPLGGISTSLKSVFLILTNTLPSLYQLTQPGSPIDQVH